MLDIVDSSIYYILIVVLVVLLVRLKVVDRIWNLFSRSDHPIISASDYVLSDGLQMMAAGKLADSYIYNLKTNRAGKVMVFITMEHHTNMHIVALGAASGLASRLAYGAGRKWLEPVSLEGDFPEHFKMYCSKDKQMEVRQVFGPETMAQFVDFCRSYNFELFDNHIYISVAEGASDPADTTTMITDITNFIIHNKQVFDRLV